MTKHSPFRYFKTAPIHPSRSPWSAKRATGAGCGVRSAFVTPDNRAAASLYPRPCSGCSDSAGGSKPHAFADHRRLARPAQPNLRLLVSRPLPLGRSPLRRRDTPPARRWRRTPCCLSPRLGGSD